MRKDRNVAWQGRNAALDMLPWQVKWVWLRWVPSNTAGRRVGGWIAVLRKRIECAAEGDAIVACRSRSAHPAGHSVCV